MEPYPAFLDRVWNCPPEQLSKEDIIRYLEQGQAAQALAPSVRTILLSLVQGIQR